jgi:hypothetical protein
MARVWRLTILLPCFVTATRAAGPATAIDATSPAAMVSPLSYGLTEEITPHRRMLLTEAMGWRRRLEFCDPGPNCTSFEL